MVLAGFVLARTGAAQDPPAPDPSPAPSAEPPGPAEPAPSAPAPAPSETAPAEDPYEETAPTPVPAPTPSPTPPPTATTLPAPPPTAPKPAPTYTPAPTPKPAPTYAPVTTATTATTAKPTAPPARAPVADKKSAEDEHEGWGLFGPLRFGPVVGVGLPSVLSFGGTVKLTRFLGGGITVGMIPTIKVSFYGDATVSYQHYEAYGRLYPFGGSFFLGAGAGYATIRGTLKSTYPLGTLGIPGLPESVDFQSEASVRTMMLSPTIGFFHTFGSGFSIGIDAGAQIPIAPSEITFNTAAPSVPAEAQPLVNAAVASNDEDVRKQLEKMGQTILPTFGIKIGWLL